MKKSFTMIEVIFVIVIIGILAAIALPKFKENINETSLKKVEMELNKVQMGIQNKLSSNILSGKKNCPVLEEDNDKEHVFEKINPLPTKSSNIKIEQDDNTTYSISIDDKYNFDIEYKNTLKEGCKLKCKDINNCPVNLD